MRRRVAAALTQSCQVLRLCLDISSGEVDPSTGLLAAATGETSTRIGLDGGLYAALQPLYAAATAAGRAIQVRGHGGGCMRGPRRAGWLAGAAG